MRKKVFQSSLNRYLLLVLILYVIYILGMCYGIMIVYENIPDNDSLKVPYLIAMIASGFILFLCTLIPIFVNINKEITITPTSIEYRHGNREFKVTWRDLLYKSPGRFSRYYRNALVSNGKIFGNIDNLFFRDFETIVKVVEMAKDIKGSGTIEL